jgi:hypothetical protein
METIRDFSAEDNKKICPSCCLVFLFYLLLVRREGSRKIDQVINLIFIKDWSCLFENEVWFACFKQALLDIKEGKAHSAVRDQFDLVLSKYFQKEIRSVDPEYFLDPPYC